MPMLPMLADGTQAGSELRSLRLQILRRLMVNLSHQTLPLRASAALCLQSPPPPPDSSGLQFHWGLLNTNTSVGQKEPS